MVKITKLFMGASILLSSCSTINRDVVFYTKSVKKSLHNLEQLEMWIEYDREMGIIPNEIADDYALAVISTRLSLKKKYKKYDK